MDPEIQLTTYSSKLEAAVSTQVVHQAVEVAHVQVQDIDNIADAPVVLRRFVPITVEAPQTLVDSPVPVLQGMTQHRLVLVSHVMTHEVVKQKQICPSRSRLCRLNQTAEKFVEVSQA